MSWGFDNMTSEMRTIKLEDELKSNDDLSNEEEIILKTYLARAYTIVVTVLFSLTKAEPYNWSGPPSKIF